MGKSPACLSWPRAGPCEGYSEQELCREHHLLGGQRQPLCRTLLAVASATSCMQLYTSLHVNVCMCIKILAKVVNDRITNFITLKSPRHSAGAFPKPGNQSAGLGTLSSAQTSARKAHCWQEAPRKPLRYGVSAEAAQTMLLHGRYLKFMCFI